MQAYLTIDCDLIDISFRSWLWKNHAVKKSTINMVFHSTAHTIIANLQ